MIYAVTGAGPRTGTSWTMAQLEKAGLPIYQSAHMKIPGAEYETDWKELSTLNHVIAKVWPATLSQANVGRMVVLRRNRDCQIHSLHKQMEREMAAGYKFNDTAEEIIDRCIRYVNNCRIPKIEIPTENLNQEIGSIIEWLSVPFEQERVA